MSIGITSSGVALWQALLPKLAAFITECPRPVMEERLRQAAFDFLNRSYCWRERNVLLLTTVAEQSIYDYDLPANGKLLAVHGCYDGLTEVRIETEGEGDDFSPEETSVRDWGISVSDDGTALELRPTPSAADIELKGSVSFTLSDNAAGIPQWIASNFGREIAHGAAASLVIEENKPWTNPAAYQLHIGEFEAAVALASNQAGPVRRRGLRVKPSVI